MSWQRPRSTRRWKLLSCDSRPTCFATVEIYKTTEASGKPKNARQKRLTMARAARTIVKLRWKLGLLAVARLERAFLDGIHEKWFAVLDLACWWLDFLCNFDDFPRDAVARDAVVRRASKDSAR